MAATGAGDLQERAEAVVDELASSGAETGLQVAVVRNGRLVADAAGGVADPGTGRPVTPDTLLFAVSTAKGVASTVAHVLAERGVAVAVMCNRFTTGDFTAAAKIGRLAAGLFS